MATISASNQEKMHKGFLPLLPGFKYIEFGDLAAAAAAIGPHTAGFLVEPIQLRCLPIKPAISNMLTWALPNTALSLSSALMLRLLVASCSLCFLM